MPLSDLDPNANISSGRNSRTSNFSGSHKDGPRPSVSSKSGTPSVASGVFSMLKTTTETGDLGSLQFGKRRLPNVHRGLGHRPSEHAPSRTSSHYSKAGSVRSRTSNHSYTEHSILSVPGSWPHTHGSHPASNDPHLHADDRYSAASGKARALPRSISDQFDQEQRSYSLTSSLLPSRSLGKQRSANSLRSQGPLQRPRSPYRYPTRLRRPGYRPASPAFSDGQGASYYRNNIARPGPGPRAFSTTQPFSPNKQYEYSGYHNSQVLAPPPRTYELAEDFERRPMVADGRASLSAQFHPAHSYRVAPSSPATFNFANYNRPGQPFRSTPSPLREDGSRSAHVKQLERTVADITPYTGFVQRVKHILEERSSSDEVRRNRQISGSRAQMDMDNTTPAQASSPSVTRLSRNMIKAAVDPVHDSEVGSTPGYLDTDSYNVQSEQSSGKGSSMREKSSVDFPRTTSTPDLVGHREGAVSEVDTSDSSADSSSPAAKFSLRIAVQRATAPTISESSHSLTDLVDLHDEPSLELADGYGQQQFAERPYSFPLLFEQKTETMGMARQSLPAQAELQRRTPPRFPPVHRDNQALDDIMASLPPSVEHESSGEHPTTPDGQVHEPSVSGNDKHAEFQDESSLDNDSVDESGPASTVETPAWASASIAARKSFMSTTIASNRSSMSAFNESQSSLHDVQRSSAAIRRPAVRDSVFRDSVSSIDEKPTTQLGSDGNEPRMSAMKQFHFPLPDLTEDSQEDASTTNLRMLGAKPPIFRVSGPRGVRGEARGRGRNSTTPQHASSYLSRKIANTRGIPSFNFSNNDLTVTLNRALGLRSSQSLEEIATVKSRRRRSTHGFRALQSQDVPWSDRERYRSFFSEHEDSEEEEPTVEATENTTPQELLTEIDRISIPSVNGLTIRLSELLPSIKRCDSEADLTKSDDALEPTNDRIHDLSSPERLASTRRASVISTHSTAAMLTNDVVKINVISVEDRSASQLSGRPSSNTGFLRLMKDLPPLPSDVMSPRPSVASGPARSIPLTPGNEIHVGNVPELDTPTALSRPPTQKFKLKRQSNRTLAATITPDTRPWNTEGNYPWSEEGPSTNITIPDAGRDCGSPVSRLRAKVGVRRSGSTSNLESDAAIRVARTMSPGPRLDMNLAPTSDALTDTDQTLPSRKGALGSLIRKMGMKSRVEKGGVPNDSGFSHSDERAVEPGDRYPTTSLTPPGGLTVDDTRSFFSDSSSEGERPHTSHKRNRLTKQKRSASRALSLGDALSERRRGGSAAGNGGSIFGESPPDVTDPDVIMMMYDQPPVGMSKMEFRAKRMVERLRSLWFKSGSVIRHFGQNKKQAPSWYASSELYDGV